jgi:hypothetical protein
MRTIAVEPKFTDLRRWLVMTGMTRTATYEAIRRRELSAIKQPGGTPRGGRVLIDVEQGLAWLRSRRPLLLKAA